MNTEISAPEMEWRGEPVFVGLTPGPHLFIDDFLISESTNLVRTTHQPEKLPEPVIRKGAAWHLQPQWFMKVAYDALAGLFRAWYNVRNPGGHRGTGIGSPYICYAYAESLDAIHWEKPEQDLDARHYAPNHPATSSKGEGSCLTILSFGTPRRNVKQKPGVLSRRQKRNLGL